MLRKALLSFLFSFPLLLNAQSAFTGNIFDNLNRSVALEGVTVKNLTSRSLTLTAKDGHFALPAKVGDLISFGSIGYETDTVFLTNLFPKNVYLRVQVNNLNTVDVNGVKISPYLNVKDPNAMPARTVDYGKERGGIRLALGANKFKRQQLKVQELEERDEYLEEINRSFTPEFVTELVKLEGADLKTFMQLYRPTVDQIKAERPFNYPYYTAKSYRAWLALPADQRKLPSLVSPFPKN